jgi:hypothetical protein
MRGPEDTNKSHSSRGADPNPSKQRTPLNEVKITTASAPVAPPDGGEAVNLGKMDFAPGKITLVPDLGMVLPLGQYSLVDFIDGSLIQRCPAPYDQRITLLDVSELVSLVSRLDTVSIPILGGALTKRLNPHAWAKSIDEINLAFEEGEDPLSQRSFEEVGMISRSRGENPDYAPYAIKLGRFVESVRELHNYMEYQRALGTDAGHRADVDKLEMFLSQALGRAYARCMTSS